MKTGIILMAVICCMFSFTTTNKTADFGDLKYVGSFTSTEQTDMPVNIEVYVHKVDSTNIIYASFSKYAGEKALYLAGGKCIYKADGKYAAGFVMAANKSYTYTGKLN